MAAISACMAAAISIWPSQAWGVKATPTCCSQFSGPSGDFGYDGSVNRAVAVNSGALREALAKIYHADRIVDELTR